MNLWRDLERIVMDRSILYLFGDQTYDVHPYLNDLRNKQNPVLKDFLSKAYNAIRTEIDRLPHDDLPRLTCFDDLQQEGRKPFVPLDMAVTCIYQLGLFISQVGPGCYGDNASVLGLCTGSLAAAAVSCSRSVLELTPLGVEAVILAFRIGLRVMDVAQRVDCSKSDQSWSMIATNSAAVDNFIQETALPLTSRPYISAYLPNGIVVSGPPSQLAHLGELNKKSLPIYGPYHAPHLYCEEDVDDIVGSVNLSGSERYIPYSSTNDLEGGNFKTILKFAIRGILLEPIRWSGIFQGLKSNPKTFSIIPVGTNADRLIYQSMEAIPPKAERTISAFEQLPKPTPRPLGIRDKQKLAIVGISGRFPQAEDTTAFWKVLHDGLDVHKPVPALHWDATTHVDITASRKNTSATAYGCWIDNPAAFDARFFNISPREAPQIDPAQRLALMTAYEAIEQAGIVAGATPSTRNDRVGVFYGVTSMDWMETNSAQNIDTYFIPGGNRAFIPGRINYHFKFSGPSFVIDTACSSSLAGIHLACNSLWMGDIDTAIAGGTNILTNPDMTAGLDRGHFLSRTGNCKTFDDSADGYCRGEGVGTVIIKRLDDALADNDPILGVILGTSTNHSAESESITRPHVGAQREIYTRILDQSGISPFDVSYVEMHGTGTQAGDAGEMSSVLETFAPPDKRKADQPLYLGSAKANIGHGESASGVSSLIKVLLMMQKNTIVPHCGIKTKINHRFPTDLQARNVNIALEPTAWVGIKRAFVNNFSAAGGNSAVLLEDAPVRKLGSDLRSHHPVAISAKTGRSLQGNLRAMLAYLDANVGQSLSSLSYTTTARRVHHQHRVMLTGASVEEIRTQIELALRDQTGMTRSKSTPQIVFAFTGQGAQYPGMMRGLEIFSSFRTEIRRLDRIGQKLGFPSFIPFIHDSSTQYESSQNPRVIQLASVCTQIALSRLWMSWNIYPKTVIGHSLGEYAALCIAGVLSDADTIYLVGKRAELLVSMCMPKTHAMLVVTASVDEITAILERYEVACINSPIETVLAGPADDISFSKGLLAAAGIKATLLRVPYAFHSSQMDPILPDFRKIAIGVSFSKPRIPIVCPLDGSVVVDSKFSPEYLARHSREPVNMLKALPFITEQVIEIGPHPAISGMIRAFGSQFTPLASAQRGRPAIQTLTTALKSLYVAGAEICWSKYHNGFSDFQEVLPLPAYAWDLKDYWIQYVNDWSLRKGDPITNLESIPLSSTIHEVVKETQTQIIVETDIARKDFSPLVKGHEVDGIPLCTPSVYAEIALSLGRYIFNPYRKDNVVDVDMFMDKDMVVDVADMLVSKALILSADRQLLQVHAEMISSSATIKFMSFDRNKKLQQHAQCVVKYTTKHSQQNLQKESAEIHKKIQILRNGLISGDTTRYNRVMMNRAIRTLARFSEDYRAIDEIVLSSSTLEAFSRISFGSVKREGTFHTHPAIIESLTQSCGYTMNCNDGNDLDVDVFMIHGWESFQIFTPMDLEKKYTAYTWISEGLEKLWHGNVIVFDGEEVVAYLEKIAIQSVPRRVLKAVLSIESGKWQREKKSEPVPTSINVIQSSTETTSISYTSKLTHVLSIIAEESGLAFKDLTNETNFGDVGMDSLLAMAISNRLKDELNMNLDFNALFYVCPTVGDLRTYLGESSPTMTTKSTPGSIESPSNASTNLTPLTEQESFVDFQSVLRIVSEESGIATEDLTDDTNFMDSGVDSLLSLIIVNRLRDELGLAIQHESLFVDCPSVGELRLSFGMPDKSTTIVEEDRSRNQEDILIRKRVVDEYVRKYTAGFSSPRPSASVNDGAKVVLITGASGSLGSHLVDAIARSDVKRVVCLNRHHKTEAYLRQKEAMTEKSILSFDEIRPKLLVLQTDASKPLLGLSDSEYDGLVNQVTHIIHNAWPMSVKRPLEGFESQFQIMRNLIDLAWSAVCSRSDGFRFSFQLVSSISVVGNYNLTQEPKNGNGVKVPEKRHGIESVMPSGYGDAKWGCERMLDETLHKYSDRFRPMVVRLGQIAGSSSSGCWNTTEHFAFLIKSSQTLKALPDTIGSAYWTPVNEVAATLADLLSNSSPYPIYHIDNPVGQPWRELNAVLADALHMDIIPWTEWIERVRAARQNNPAALLLDFFDSNYLRMSCGGLILDVTKAVEHSTTLSRVGAVSDDVVRKYIRAWKEVGWLT